MTTKLQGTVTTKTKVKVKVRLTADDWQLFTASMDCTQAADDLNRAASEALSQNDPSKAAFIFHEAATANMDFGALDTEPRNVFADLFVDRFGIAAWERHGL